MEFLKSILSEKTLKALTDALGDDLVKSINEKTKDFKIDVAEERFIPKLKFDEVNNQLKDYRSQIDERDKQLKELAEKAKGNEELTKQIQELQRANETTKAEYEAKILAREKDFAIESELLKYKAKNTKAVKALLNLDKVELKEGKLNGLEEQLKELKEKESYLFEIDKSKDDGGLDPSQSGDKRIKIDRFDDLRKIR